MAGNKFSKLLNKGALIIWDGAMGTMLQELGLAAGELPEIYNILYPEKIVAIHKQYLDAGAQVLTTNTFGANRLKLAGSGYTVEQIIVAAVSNAQAATGDKCVALDIGPLGQLLEPLGTLSFAEAYDLFKEQAIIGERAGVDLVIIETIADLYEAKAAILAVKENTKLPVICTMTFELDGRTYTGTDVPSMVTLLSGLGVDALGINCSLGPVELLPLVETVLEYSRLPVMVQANAGLPKIINGETVYQITPSEYLEAVEQMIVAGVQLIGGCCGTTDSFIKQIVNKLKGYKQTFALPDARTAVCSASKTVFLDEGVRVIGERINPTGKKRFQEALRNREIDYVLNEAILQKEAGADILDINLGLPGIDEQQIMVEVLKEIQAISNIPLQIDSSDYSVIEAAARNYNGIPLINSVNGSEESMSNIFPIVAKYGAAVIALTLDEKGIPNTAEERFAIAKRIVDRAREYGIAKERVIIDSLVLTASAQQNMVMETIKTIRLVREELGILTSLGVSNVSFGLPNRALLNQTFLTMALNQGLNLPIINPLDKNIMDTIMAYNVLTGEDMDAVEFIAAQSKLPVSQHAAVLEDRDRTLVDLIIKGLKEDAAAKTRELLQELEPLEIVNEHIIKALDIVGKQYENDEIFLPQLIQAAEAVKRSFVLIKEKMESTGENQVTKGIIVLATVKGDVHDIGKNIVKVLLENYGYEVIDLGKDVPITLVVETAKESGAKLVGLSALMTTTVKNMEETITALRDSVATCKVIVGGAVLTEEYAQMIGADYYAKDAQDAVRTAREIYK